LLLPLTEGSESALKKLGLCNSSSKYTGEQHCALFGTAHGEMWTTLQQDCDGSLAPDQPVALFVDDPAHAGRSLAYNVSRYQGGGSGAFDVDSSPAGFALPHSCPGAVAGTARFMAHGVCSLPGVPDPGPCGDLTAAAPQAFHGWLYLANGGWLGHTLMRLHVSDPGNVQLLANDTALLGPDIVAGPGGLAVDSATGDVYVANGGGGRTPLTIAKVAACEPTWEKLCPVSLVVDSAGCEAAFGASGQLAGILPNPADSRSRAQEEGKKEEEEEEENAAAAASLASAASAFVVSYTYAEGSDKGDAGTGAGAGAWVDVFALSEGFGAGARRGSGSGSLALLGRFNVTGHVGPYSSTPATAALDPHRQVVYVMVGQVVYGYGIASGKARTVYTCSDGAPEGAAVPWGGGACTGVAFDGSRRALLLLAAGGVSILADSGAGAKLTPAVAAVSLLVAPGYLPTLDDPAAFFRTALQPWTVAVDSATGAAYSMIAEEPFGGEGLGFDLFELRY
jgi:DNA-binding beta-propeller fold protein YncE